MWQYLARCFFAIVLPVITAAPLARYVRGKAALISGPLLLIITLLPVSSCWSVVADLHDGPAEGRFTIVRDSETGRLVCRGSDVNSEGVPCEDNKLLAGGDEGASLMVTTHAQDPIDEKALRLRIE